MEKVQLVSGRFAEAGGGGGARYLEDEFSRKEEETSLGLTILDSAEKEREEDTGDAGENSTFFRCSYRALLRAVPKGHYTRIRTKDPHSPLS